jgi:hypothetical protein
VGFCQHLSGAGGSCVQIQRYHFSLCLDLGLSWLVIASFQWEAGTKVTKPYIPCIKLIQSEKTSSGSVFVTKIRLLQLSLVCKHLIPGIFHTWLNPESTFNCGETLNSSLTSLLCSISSPARWVNKSAYIGLSHGLNYMIYIRIHKH